LNQVVGGLMMREHKHVILARLLRESWMRDAGWTDEQIANHYQRDRDHRAAVKRLRRAGIAPTIKAIEDYQRRLGKPLFEGTGPFPSS
jgi:hypothetical protein